MQVKSLEVSLTV